MNCYHFENMVHDLAREQIMEASVRLESLAHCDECEACARRLEDERALSFKLRALVAEMRFAEAPGLEDAVRTAFRHHQFAIRRPVVAHRWRYWAAAAAAMVLAVIAVAEMRSRTQKPTAQNPPNLQITSPGVTPETVVAKAPAIVVDSRPSVLSPKNAAPVVRRPTRNPEKKTNQGVAPRQPTPGPNSKDAAETDAATTVAANHSATEITTDFMPVGYTTATNLQDGGQIVRVQLPRSTLVAFGLPVNMDRYNEKVKADVFFGADGVARAIRFVQ